MPRDPNEPVFRHWTGAIFNDNPLKEEWIEKLRAKCRYYIFGSEIAPSTGNHHFQYYLYTREAINETQARKLVEPSHIDWCVRPPICSNDYCKKDKQYFEWGLAPHQGKRKDLDEVRRSAANGQFLDVINHGSYQQMKVAEKWLTYCGEKRKLAEPCKVIWIYGDSRTGKSKKIRELAGDSYYNKMGNKWWDGYINETTVIMEDFRLDDFNPKDLLTWWDRHDCRVEVKGGTVQLLADTFLISTIYSPKETFGPVNKDSIQFYKRITEVIFTDRVEIEEEIDWCDHCGKLVDLPHNCA